MDRNRSPRTIRQALISLLLMSGVAAPAAMRVGAQDAPPDTRADATRGLRRLLVTGHGEVRVQPDKADITIGVVTENRSSQAAAAANAAASQAVQKAIRGLGVADRDIQTISYSILPLTTGGYNNQKPAITGYRVTNEVRVTVRDLSKVGSIIDAASAAGSNSIDEITFGIQNRAPHQEDALAQAVGEARRKADRLARAANVTVTGIYEIDEGVPSRPGPVPMMGRAMAAEVATPVAPGELTVAADVTIVYQITAAPRASNSDRGSRSASLPKTPSASVATSSIH